MLDWLRNLLGPTPAMAAACPGRLTLPAVLAFSEQGGGGGEAPATPPAEKPAETPAAPPSAPPAETVTTPTGKILGRPLMIFICDAAAGLGALLTFVAFFLPYLNFLNGGWPGFRLILGWQGLLTALFLLFLAVSTVTFWKKANWAMIYADCGAFLLGFVILQIVVFPAGPHVGWFFTLFGSILMLAGGVLQWLVFKSSEIDKPWPHGVTFKCPGV